MTKFSSREISLLHHHLRFYHSLQAGVIPLNNEERRHFHKALMGEVDAKTEHEKVYLKYLSGNKQKIDAMVHAWSLNKSNPRNPDFDDEFGQ